MTEFEDVGRFDEAHALIEMDFTNTYPDITATRLITDDKIIIKLKFNNQTSGSMIVTIPTIGFSTDFSNPDIFIGCPHISFDSGDKLSHECTLKELKIMFVKVVDEIHITLEELNLD